MHGNFLPVNASQFPLVCVRLLGRPLPAPSIYRGRIHFHFAPWYISIVSRVTKATQRRPEPNLRWSVRNEGVRKRVPAASRSGCRMDGSGGMKARGGRAVQGTNAGCISVWFSWMGNLGEAGKTNVGTCSDCPWRTARLDYGIAGSCNIHQTNKVWRNFRNHNFQNSTRILWNDKD